MAVPAIDQLLARDLPRSRRVDGAMIAIRGDCIRGASGCQMPRRLALPILLLTTDVGNLDAAMALGDRAECRAGLDGLELLGIADQHNLGAAFLGLGNHALHLPRSDHPGFVDDQHVTMGQQLPVLRPLMLETGNRSRRNAGAAFQILRGNARQRRTLDLITGALPRLTRNAEHR